MRYTKRKYFFITLVCGLLAFSAFANPNKSEWQSLLPVSLRCEHGANPLGIDATNPKLEWRLQATSSSARGLKQTAYQILVASSQTLLNKNAGDIWNSGKVFSDKTNRVVYKGKDLSSHQTVYWKVLVWDKKGNASGWSSIAQWTMGILQSTDWSRAKWIGAPEKFDSAVNSTILLRREFKTKYGLKRAIISICGLGQYEMSINGKSLTKTILNPGWTQYNKTCLYDTYDITSLLNPGNNAAGLLLSNGMYRVKKGGRYAKFEHSFGRLQAIAKMQFEYSNGTIETLITDENWKAGQSAMTWSSIYGGEDWDARKVQTGWDKANFNDTAWLAVEILKEPGGQLKGITHAAPPVKTFALQQPVSKRQIKPNVFIYDLGQDASYISTFTATGPSGSVIKITPGELLNDDGTLFRNNYNARSYSVYTMAGMGKESYTSKFFTTGCRYYQVECIPPTGSNKAPKLQSIGGIVVHSDNEFAGNFSCSNELFNRIYKMIKWAELSNMKSVISDCPHRERLGWLEQSHLHGPSFRYNYDMQQLYRKIIHDMNDTKQPNGLVPCIAPELTVFGNDWREATEWGSASVLIPWQEYEWTGDIEILRSNFAMMKGYLDYVAGKAKNGVAAVGKGDWSGRRASPHTPKEFISTAFYYGNTSVVAKAASLLKNDNDAKKYEALAKTIKAIFNTTFFNDTTKQYASGSQCANAMALAMGLVDSVNRDAVLNNLIADIETRRYENTTGEVGMRYLLEALADGGRSDVVYAMNNQDKLPGYGYQLKMGATALPETWDAWRDNSQNQFMLGHIVQWFYQHLAGIQREDRKTGWKNFVIRPAMIDDLTEVKGSYQSAHGMIVSEWKQVGKKVAMYVVVPPNTKATVYVPAKNAVVVKESGKPIAQMKGGKFTRMQGLYAIVTCGSGAYRFESVME